MHKNMAKDIMRVRHGWLLFYIKECDRYDPGSLRRKEVEATILCRCVKSSLCLPIC